MTTLTPEQEARLIADLNGERGLDWQAAAEEWAQQEGFDLETLDETTDEAFWREASTQIQRMEGENGRPFTQAEIDKMLDYHGESDELPDMAAAYDGAVGRPTGGDFYRDKDARQAAAVEAYEAHRAAGEEGDDI